MEFRDLFPRWIPWLVVVWWFAWSPVAAEPVESEEAPWALETLLQQADEQRLWEARHWLSLLHYEQLPGDLLSASQVDDPRFFLSMDGRTNPRAELIATLEALFEPTGSDADRHAQCRFPARFSWLEARLGWPDMKRPRVRCAAYLQWREQVQAARMTLVFPAAYLNSPSSMFGHTLLRLDPDEDGEGSRWLSSAVNYGAQVSPDDNSLLYMYKGLTGGYPGQFVVMPYFKKIQEYNRIENRDIWEYQLGFSVTETDRLVAHLWELQAVNFDYYFFRENCSFRLLELLEVARPGLELTQRFDWIAIPVDTVRVVEEAGLVDAVHYRPSEMSRVQALLDGMSPQELDAVERLHREPKVGSGFSDLPLASRRDVAEAAYTLSRIAQSGQPRDPQAAAHSHALLALRHQNAGGIDPPLTMPTRPEHGHDSARVLLESGTLGDDPFLGIAVRPAYHSHEDPQPGFPPGAQINMGNLWIRAIEGEGAELWRLDLVDIFSLTPRTRFVKSWSWQVRTGVERAWIHTEDRLVGHLSGGGGWTWHLGPGARWYGLGTLRLEGHREHDSNLTLQPGAQVGAQFVAGGISVFADSSLWWVPGERRRIQAQAQLQYALGRNHSIGAGVQRQWEQEARTSINFNYRLYF